MWRLVLVLVVLWSAATAAARSPDEPVRLKWEEGDVAGITSIWAADGSHVVGFVEYRQTHHDDVLHVLRIARYRDGSSDEDEATARITDDRLEAVGGKSVIRDRKGSEVVDLEIDVAARRVHGTLADGGQQRPFDEQMDLSAGTYWGPLVFIVLKNFDVNAEDGRLAFRTVVPTPKPRLLELEFVRREPGRVDLFGGALDAVRFSLRPSIHWAIDPILHLFVPSGEFFLLPGQPPALARFDGPRNYAGERIRLE